MKFLKYSIKKLPKLLESFFIKFVECEIYHKMSNRTLLRSSMNSTIFRLRSIQYNQTTK